MATVCLSSTVPLVAQPADIPPDTLRLAEQQVATDSIRIAHARPASLSSIAVSRSSLAPPHFEHIGMSPHQCAALFDITKKLDIASKQ